MDLPSPRASRTSGNVEQVLRRLELSVTRRLDGLLQGDYRGLVPGHGTEAGETRGYQPGDDVRRIDWNVTARFQQPYVRETIADRELETWVLADFSASLAFGTADCEKRDLAMRRHRRRRLPHPAHRQPHRRTVDPRRRQARHRARPGRQGPPHGPAPPGARAQRAEDDHNGAPTSTAPSAAWRAATVRRRGLVVVISDFLASRRLGASPSGPGRPPRGPGRRGRRSPRARAAGCRRARPRRPRDRRAARGADLRTPRTCESATRQRPRHSGPPSPKGSAAPAPITCSCAPTATGCSTWCSSSPSAAASGSSHAGQVGR